MDSTAGFGPCCDIFSCLVAVYLFLWRGTGGSACCCVPVYLEGIRLFLSGRTSLFQRFEIINCSQNVPGLPLSCSYSDHDEAACIFSLSGVLNCFYLCGEIIEHL